MRLSYILYLTFIVAALSVRSNNAQPINLDVNGIRIQASYRSIVKKLGKPVSDRRKGEVPCGDAMRILSYSGLILRLEVGGSNPIGLYKAEVTSRRWRVSGIRIGDNKAKVIQRFGKADEFKKKGKHYLRYWIRDGWSNFYFNGNRLRAITWEYNFC